MTTLREAAGRLVKAAENVAQYAENKGFHVNAWILELEQAADALRAALAE